MPASTRLRDAAARVPSRVLSALVTFAFLALASGRATAQAARDGAVIAASCAPELLARHAMHEIDTLHLALPDSDRAKGEKRVFRETLMQEIARHFRMPARLKGSVPVPFAVDTTRGPRAILGPRVGAEVALTLGADGSLQSLRLTNASDLAELDRALLAAVRAADSTGGFGPIPKQIGRAPYELRITLTDRATTEKRAAIPLAQYEYDVLRATQPVLPTREGGAPAYPEAARRQGINDEVRMSFIVGTDGRVEPGSLRVVEGRYREFILSVADYLLTRARYAPARVGDCAVRQLVAQSFDFRVR